MKKEVEILFELRETEKSAIKKLRRFIHVGKRRTIDIYYFDPKRKALQPTTSGRLKASFRLRNQGRSCSLAYKIDHFKKGLWIYSDEYETPAGDFKKAQAIIRQLGLKRLVKVDATKNVFKDKIFEVVIEKVSGLGLFLEVEYHFVADNKRIEDAKEYIRRWIKERGIRVGKEMNAGKPELLLGRCR